MERCVLTDLFPDQCACPRHRNIPDEVSGYETGKVIPAQWGGICRGCLITHYHTGDRVVQHGTGWLAYDCPCNKVGEE